MWVFFICSSLRKQALCWKGHKLWQDGRKVFANRLHRSRCFPLKYAACSWTDVSSLDSNPLLRIVCQFIAVKAWTMLRKPLVRREKGTIHSVEELIKPPWVLWWNISFIMSLHILFFFSQDVPDFCFSEHGRGRCPTPRPQVMLDSPTCQIKFIASRWRKDLSLRWWL